VLASGSRTGIARFRIGAFVDDEDTTRRKFWTQADFIADCFDYTGILLRLGVFQCRADNGACPRGETSLAKKLLVSFQLQFGRLGVAW
jgi:hypothetical protein